MSKILCIGDPHFKITTLPLMEVFVSRTIGVVKKYSPDRVIILGDILHTHERLHSSVMNKACDWIDQLRQLKPVYLIVGNHDYINNTQFLSDRHWMNPLKEWDNVKVIDSPQRVGDIVLCPYVFPGRFREALDTLKGWESAKVICCHQEFKGCKMGALVSEIGDEWEASLPDIISGHIHDKQTIQSNIYYTGSSVQHAFGETHNKTIALYSVGNGIKDIEEISLDLPIKKIIYKDFTTIQRYIPPQTKDKIRITLQGNAEEFKSFRKTAKYKQLTNDGVSIVFKSSLHVIDETTDLTPTSFEDVLYKLCDTDPQKEMYKRFIFS